MPQDGSKALAARGLEGRKALPATLTIAAGRQHTAETILRAWFAGKSENTIRAYRRDLEAFAQFLSLSLGIRPSMSVNAALDKFFRQSAPSAHEIVLAFREFLVSANPISGDCFVCHRDEASRRFQASGGRVMPVPRDCS